VRHLWLSTVTLLRSPMSHSSSPICVTHTLDALLGVGSAAMAVSKILLLQFENDESNRE